MIFSPRKLLIVLMSILAPLMLNCIDIGTTQSTDQSALPSDNLDGGGSDAADASNVDSTDEDDKDGQTEHDGQDASALEDTQSTPDVDEAGECTVDDTSACAALPNTLDPGCGFNTCTYNCEPGFSDLNGDLGEPGSDGCEYTCSGSADSVELCDNVDNNCDGEIDEGFAGLGSACTVGVGACATTGEVVCSSDGSQAECDASAEAPSLEICNGVDDDCDGEVDNGLDGAYYRDQDGDGFGRENIATRSEPCNFSDGYTVSVAGDCDDTDPAINPDAAVQCGLLPNAGNGPTDFNCNGKTLCEEDDCAGTQCVNSEGEQGVCGNNSCSVLIIDDGECSTDSDCPGTDICQCQDPGPSICCERYEFCPCLASE